jgi:hypothetical protein
MQHCTQLEIFKADNEIYQLNAEVTLGGLTAGDWIKEKFQNKKGLNHHALKINQLLESWFDNKDDCVLLKNVSVVSMDFVYE